MGVESGRERAQKGLVIMTPGCPGNSDRGRETATATAAVAAAAVAATESRSESRRRSALNITVNQKNKKKKTNAGSAAAPAIVYRISHIVYRLRDLLPSSLASSIQFEPFVVLFLVK